MKMLTLIAALLLATTLSGCMGAAYTLGNLGVSTVGIFGGKKDPKCDAAIKRSRNMESRERHAYLKKLGCTIL